MDDTNTPDNISKTQSPRAMHTIGCFYAGVTHHLCRHCGFYGFVSGIAATLLTLWAILWYGIFAYPLPWKITDPMDPRFNPEKFRFTDYQNNQDLVKVIRTLLPIGTDKEDVDRLLTDAGARISPYIKGKNEKNPPNLFYYRYWNYRSVFFAILYMTPADEFDWEVGVFYDKNDRVQLIRPIGS